MVCRRAVGAVVVEVVVGGAGGMGCGRRQGEGIDADEPFWGRNDGSFLWRVAVAAMSIVVMVNGVAGNNASRWGELLAADNSTREGQRKDWHASRHAVGTAAVRLRAAAAASAHLCLRASASGNA